jgi:hypothetical protein
MTNKSVSSSPFFNNKRENKNLKKKSEKIAKKISDFHHFLQGIHEIDARKKIMNLRGS